MRASIAFVAISMGVLLFWFRKEFAVFCIKEQNRFWGFRFGERTIRGTEVMAAVMALVSMVLGLLCAFGVGHIQGR